MVCKPVVFGESRSSVHQTATLCHTMTNNIELTRDACVHGPGVNIPATGESTVTARFEEK